LGEGRASDRIGNYSAQKVSRAATEAVRPFPLMLVRPEPS
jgi:hypothetical protein